MSALTTQKEAIMSKKIKWNSGPPPHVGWWNANTECDELTWRWWDGARWSIACDKYHSIRWVEGAALTPSLTDARMIKWRDYWPENARVPRVKP